MNEEEHLKGLGGWLILVGLGVVFNPFRLLAMFLPLYSSIFTDGTWEALTTPGTDSYNALWGPILVGEMAFNSALVCASIFMAFLFFTKSHLFPKVYIGIVLASLAFIPLDAWAASFVLPDEPMFDPATSAEFAKSLLASLIWIPYMRKSRRVKATFVNGLPQNLEDPVLETFE